MMQRVDTPQPTPAELIARAYAPIRADLDHVVEVFDAELESDLPFIEQMCDTVRAYRGKLLRPGLLLLCGSAAGGVRREHHTLGAVVEMVHMATLVHDDVLDRADERRRQPTIARLSGNEAAVLLGDFLISHAYHLCSSLNDQHAARRVAATTNTVCEGELLQNAERGNGALTESAYLEIVRRKTGVLTSLACELGARYAGAGEAEVEALASFGLSLGVAFQIVDDVLDLVGDDAVVGKTLGLDVQLGKLTLPVIHHLAESGSSNGGAAGELASLPPAELRVRLEATGSFAYSLARAAALVGDARDQLAILPESSARASLDELAEFVVARNL